MEESKLVGDVRGKERDIEGIGEFLQELELLMVRFQVDKIDVSWKKF